MIQYSEKANHFKPNIFTILNEKKQARLKEGKEVHDFFVGTPDFPIAEHIRKAVAEAAMDPENYKYSLVDSEELKQAVVDWYKRRYDVDLKKTELMSLNGSQEGFAHIAWTVCDPGDIVLTPNPGYPIFSDGPYLNDAVIVNYELDPDNHYMPALEKIPEDIARKAKMMVISYPLNPTCTCADRECYEKIVAFAKKYDICILHDNAYSEIEYDGRKGFSFLSIPGAKEVGVEFNSLSKSYNLTGMRVSFCLGNEEFIKKFSTIRSQFDYGMCTIVQKAAVAALNGPQEGVIAQQKAYEERRDAICESFGEAGWTIKKSEGTMFVWTEIPQGFEDDNDFVLQMLDATGVLVTPGSAFGSLGKNHVRFALVQPVDVIRESAKKVGEWLASRA